MAQFITLITAQGQAAFAAAAIPGGKTVDLTYMAVGDGGGNAVTPSSSQTALVRETFRASINSLTVDPNNANRLICDLVIPAATGGFTVREAGVFDSGGKLIGVANFPDTYKPVLDDGSAGELVVRIILQVTDTSTVKLIIDPTVVLASRQWVLDNFALGKMLPGGTTGQLLRKKSNTSGDCEWADATDASETVAGIIKLATQAMVNAGADALTAVTPAALATRLAALVASLPSSVPSAASSTASSTAAKTAALSGFVLTAGAAVAVTFANANSVAGALTLNVNNTGDVPIYDESGNAVSANTPAYFPAGSSVVFIYDGAHWVYLNGIVQSYVNGLSWYRRWSNGYTEQGGWMASTNGNNYVATLTLPIPYKDTNYYWARSTQDSGGGTNAFCQVGYTSKTANTVTFQMDASSLSPGMTWEAKGF